MFRCINAVGVTVVVPGAWVTGYVPAHDDCFCVSSVFHLGYNVTSDPALGVFGDNTKVGEER